MKFGKNLPRPFFEILKFLEFQKSELSKFIPNFPLKHAITSTNNDLESHAIILWRLISVKLNIGKKITGLEIMTLNREKIQRISKLVELIFKGELHCLQECFRKQTVREDV